MGKFSEKISNGIKTVKSNWKTAPQGSYVPYKEIAAYSIGGAGVYFITVEQNNGASTTQKMVVTH